MTKQLVWDKLAITEITDTHVVGKGYVTFEEIGNFVVDLETGNHTGGMSWPGIE